MAMTQKTFAAGDPCPPLTPGKLRLYSMRFCPFAQRTRLVLAHKNIAFETVNVHLKKKPDWFLARNPQGLVPVLEQDDKVIYESTATMDYLDEVYPQNKLVPSDPYRKAWDRILAEYFGKVTSKIYGLRTAEDKTKMIEELHKCYAYYEDILAQRGGPFFGGSAPSMIDFHMWPHMERVVALMASIDARSLVDKTKFPKFGGAWYEAMYALPAVQATMFDNETHQKFVKSYFETPEDPNYDIGLEE